MSGACVVNAFPTYKTVAAAVKDPTQTDRNVEIELFMLGDKNDLKAAKDEQQPQNNCRRYWLVQKQKPP